MSDKMISNCLDTDILSRSNLGILLHYFFRVKFDSFAQRDLHGDDPYGKMLVYPSVSIVNKGGSARDREFFRRRIKFESESDLGNFLMCISSKSKKEDIGENFHVKFCFYS